MTKARWRTLWQSYSGRNRTFEEEETRARSELLETKFVAQFAATCRAFEKLLPGPISASRVGADPHAFAVLPQLCDRPARQSRPWRRIGSVRCAKLAATIRT